MYVMSLTDVKAWFAPRISYTLVNAPSAPSARDPTPLQTCKSIHPSTWCLLVIIMIRRFRKGKPAEAGDLPGAAARATLTQRLAAKLAERVDGLQVCVCLFDSLSVCVCVCTGEGGDHLHTNT
jgi:hypothetical protein